MQKLYFSIHDTRENKKQKKKKFLLAVLIKRFI